MKKSDTLVRIGTMLKDMNQWLELAKVVDVNTENWEQRTAHLIKEAYFWLEGRRDNEVAAVKKIWFLHKPHVWETYFQGGHENFREMQLLRAALKDLKKAWNLSDRHELFNKTVMDSFKEAGDSKGLN